MKVCIIGAGDGGSTAAIQIFKDGQQVDSVLGAVPESMIQPKIKALL